MENKEELQKRYDELNSQIIPLRKALNGIRAKEEDKELRKYVDKCFRYKNSCGGEGWWLYIKVMRVSDGFLEVIEAQETSYDAIEIKKENQCGIAVISNAEEITIEEFDKEFNNVLDKIPLPVKR